MTKCENFAHDISLISDVSTLSGDEDEKVINDSSLPIRSKHVTPNESLSSSDFCISKQVRFNSAVAVSSLSKDCTTFDVDATISDEKDDFTVITPDPNGIHDQSFRLDSTNLDHILRGCYNEHPSQISPHSYSNVLESYQHDQEDRLSSSSADADSNIHPHTSPFFRTSDHLPRTPIRDSFTSNSLSSKAVPNHVPSIESARNESDASIPRPHLRPLTIDEDEFSLSSSLELTSKGSTTFSPSPSIENLPDDTPSFSEPKLHVAQMLASEIETLKNKLKNQSLEKPSEFCRQEAERLFNEACSGLVCSHNVNRNWFLNPHITVNIPEHVQTFTNLMDLSVDESEIVRQERDRIARQRKRMNELRKKAAKEKPDQPEPDLLEFFDPNRHVFQSINLHSKKALNFLPSLSRASDDFVHIFEENLASQMSRFI